MGQGSAKPRKGTPLNRLFVLAAMALLATPGLASGSLPDANGWITNEQPADQVALEDGAIVVGNFSMAGPPTAGGARVSSQTGAVEGNNFDLTRPGHDRVIVETAVSDGTGGWYVAGNFNKADGLAMPHLVHVESDGSLDTAFNPQPNEMITAIAVSPDASTVYLGGAFTLIGGKPRNGLAAVNASNGQATDWFSAVSFADQLALSPDGSLLYVVTGGPIGSPSDGRYVAQVQTSNGQRTDWSPQMDHPPIDIELDPAGAVLYLVGTFTTAGGTAQSQAAAVSTTTGVATGFHPTVSAWAAGDFEFSPDGEHLFLAGEGDGDGEVGGADSACVVELNPEDGTATSWRPQMPCFSATAIAISPDSGTLYMGDFWPSARALNTTTGALTGWLPKPDDATYAVAPSANGSAVYLGGRFTSLAAQNRDGLLRLDEEGVGVPWVPTGWTNPPPEWGVASYGEASAMALALSPDKRTLYVGRARSAVTEVYGRRGRVDLAAIDLATNQIKWATPVFDGGIGSIAPSPDGQRIYLSGTFNSVGADGYNGEFGPNRYGLAAVSAIDGSVSAWNPSPVLSANRCYQAGKIAVSPDNARLYVGVAVGCMEPGDFTYGGADHGGIVALRSDNALALDWDPELSLGVSSIIPSPDGGSIYIGGPAQTIGGQPHSGVARLAAADASLMPWEPAVTGTVHDLELVPSRGLLFVAGDIARIGNQRIYGVGGLRVPSGASIPWAPVLEERISYRVAVSDDASQVVSSGHFMSVGGRNRAFLATFTDPAPILQLPAPQPSLQSPVPTSSTTGVTGRQAAALKKCRKMRGKAKRKCKRRARKLPA